MYDSPSFDSQSGEAWLLPIYSRLTGGVPLYQNEIEEDPTLIYAPLDNPLVGYALNDVNTTEDVQRGSRNLTEQGGRRRLQVCLGLCHLAGQRHHLCIALTNILAGLRLQVHQQLLRAARSNNINDGDINNNNYRHNHRTFIGEGYRLELGCS